MQTASLYNNSPISTSYYYSLNFFKYVDLRAKIKDTFLTSNFLTVFAHRKKSKNKVKEDIALLHLIKINDQNARV